MEFKSDISLQNRVDPWTESNNAVFETRPFAGYQIQIYLSQFFVQTTLNAMFDRSLLTFDQQLPIVTVGLIDPVVNFQMKNFNN